MTLLFQSIVIFNRGFRIVMINCDLKHNKELVLEGPFPTVSAECVLVLKELYKEHVKRFNQEMGVGFMTNLLIRAISESDQEMIQKLGEPPEE